MGRRPVPPNVDPSQGCFRVLTTWQLVPSEHVVLKRGRRKLNAFHDLIQKPLTIPLNPVVDTVLLRCLGDYMCQETKKHRYQEAESIVAVLETGHHRQGQNPGVV